MNKTITKQHVRRKKYYPFTFEQASALLIQLDDQNIKPAIRIDGSGITHQVYKAVKAGLVVQWTNRTHKIITYDKLCHWSWAHNGERIRTTTPPQPKSSSDTALGDMTALEALKAQIRTERMTPDEIINVIQAYKEGAIIQYRDHNSDTWHDTVDNNPTWDFPRASYRVKPRPVRRKLERGESYYYINCYGKTSFDTNDGTNQDERLWQSGNCFRTKDGAEAAADKIRAIFEENIKSQTTIQ